MANYCDKCKVSVDKKHQNCPLCGAYIKTDEILIIKPDTVTAKEIVDYSYPKINMESIIKNLLLKIAIFISVFAMVAVVVINFLTTRKLDWCFHVIVGISLFWITFGRALFFKTNIGKQIVWDCIFAVLLIVYVQYVIGQLGAWWGYAYAVPSVIIACDVTIAATMLMKTKNWAVYSLSATVLCLISFVPLIYAFARNVGAEHFMSYICAGVGATMLVFMMLFGKKSYFLEMKKRFHI